MRRALSLPCRRTATILAAMLTAGALAATPQATSPSQAPARDSAPPPRQEPVGTGRLSVAVVAADTGAPIKRAQVMLSGFITPTRPPASVTLEVMGGVVQGPGGMVASGSFQGQPGRVEKHAQTDERGRVEFTALPAATYNLMVSPPAGFTPTQRLETLRLLDGEASSLTVRVERGGAITGRIVDDAGDPLSRVMVRVLRKRPGVGGRLMPTGNSSNTDDRGQYRIFDLPAGDYLVSATYFNPPSAFGASAAASSEPKVGFLPTYYPGATAVSDAQVVPVRAGQDSPGIDFGLLQGRLARVTGNASDSDGNALSMRSGGVTLAPRGADAFGRMLGGPIQRDGAFVIDSVPPGDYYLSAFTSRGEGPNTEREGAFVPVSVNGEDVAVTIRTNTGATLSGHVTVEGTPPAGPGNPTASLPPEASRTRVSTRPATMAITTPSFAPGKSDPVGDDGAFTVTGVRGAVLLTAYSGLAVLKSIRRAADDLTSSPLELTGAERLDNIDIVLTYDTGAIGGKVTDGRGQPVAGVWVLAFPDDSKRWYPGSPFLRSARTMSTPSSSTAPVAGAVQPGSASGVPGAPQPGASRSANASTAPRAAGEFLFPRLLPGRYYVVPIETDSNAGFDLMQYDGEALSALRQKATSVTVGVGETATVNVRLVR